MRVVLTSTEVEEAVKQYVQRELGVKTPTGVHFYDKDGYKYISIGGVDVFISKKGENGDE